MKKRIRLAAAAAAVILVISGCSKVDDISSETVPTFDSTSEDNVTEMVPDVTSVSGSFYETEQNILTISPEKITEDPYTEDLTENVMSGEISSDEENSGFTDGEEAADEEQNDLQSVLFSWTETNRSGEMYVNSDCFALEQAVPDSTPVRRYSTGNIVGISAITNTGYYRLTTGDYIRAEYLIDIPVTAEPTQTSVSEGSASEKQTTASTTVTTAKTTKKTKKTSKTSASETEGSSSLSSETTALELPGIDDPTFDSLVPASTLYRKSYMDKYAYKQLSADEQILYGEIVSAAYDLRTEIQCPMDMSFNNIQKVFLIVYNEEPQLFWLDSSFTISRSNVLNIFYKTSDINQIAKMQNEVEASASLVIAKVNAAPNTFEKLKVMYDYAVLNNTFSISAEGYNASIYNSFTNNGELQCIGYAKTIQYLCDISGIESTIVVGTNEKGETHAWNVVYCIDGYYNLDSTWGDPIIDFNPNYIKYNYFLVPDSWIRNNSHYNINTLVTENGSVYCFDPPACTKETYNYYTYLGKVYSDFDSADAALRKGFEEAAVTGAPTVEIRVTSPELFDKLIAKAATYQKYAKSQSSSITSLKMHKTDVYRNNGLVFFDIIYK